MRRCPDRPNFNHQYCEAEQSTGDESFRRATGAPLDVASSCRSPAKSPDERNAEAPTLPTNASRFLWRLGFRPGVGTVALAQHRRRSGETIAASSRRGSGPAG